MRASERGHVIVDDDYLTSAPGIYAAGDVIGYPALASTSMEQARVAVCHAFGFTYKRQVSGLLPFGVYTIPEVSCVGLGEQEAQAKGIDVVVGRALFRDNARGQILGDLEGMIKLVFDRDTRGLIGCHCIGERASELVHVGQAVIALGGQVRRLRCPGSTRSGVDSQRRRQPWSRPVERERRPHILFPSQRALRGPRSR